MNHASAYQKSCVPEGFTVEVTFSDGRKGTVDLRDALRGPMFEVLRDKAMFAGLRGKRGDLVPSWRRLFVISRLFIL
ncbi:MAG: DUF2442 domain-containing protein [Candidatus Electrothrix sp. AX5]|nr:DUF2442 domain-containing protein [Candidatus Electrothrix sp. AX5]